MKDYEFIGKSVYFEKDKTLVIADVHLGYEDALNQKGILIPRTQFEKVIEDLKKIFEETNNKLVISKNNKKLKEVIILGDLKHEFSKISGQEWRDVFDFVDFLLERAERVILVRGNHDKILPNFGNRNVKIREFYIKNENAFIHGDKLYSEILDRKIKRVFLGHLHPSVLIKDKAKAETYKCFLVGKYKKQEIVVLPSFFPLTEGVDVNKEDVEDSNLALKLNLSKFEVYIPAGNEVLEFGKLGKIGELL